MVGDSAWECECGNVEYGPIAPEECEKCFRIDSFAQLPEELLDERAKESQEAGFDLEAPMKSAKKPRLTKPKAKKKRK